MKGTLTSVFAWSKTEAIVLELANRWFEEVNQLIFLSTKYNLQFESFFFYFSQNCTKTSRLRSIRKKNAFRNVRDNYSLYVVEVLHFTSLWRGGMICSCQLACFSERVQIARKFCTNIISKSFRPISLQIPWPSYHRLDLERVSLTNVTDAITQFWVSRCGSTVSPPLLLHF